MNTKKLLCPCQTGKAYTACCGRYVETTVPAPTAEALMRSRYTAYTLVKIPYIERTQLPPVANHFDPIASAEWARSAQWLGLRVKRAWSDPNNTALAYVEFIASFITSGKKQQIYEISEFIQLEQHWYYLSGVVGK